MVAPPERLRLVLLHRCLCYQVEMTFPIHSMVVALKLSKLWVQARQVIDLSEAPSLAGKHAQPPRDSEASQSQDY